jgi:hypothetical protein
VLARLHHPDRGVGRIDPKLQVQDALLEVACHPVPLLAENLQHR